MTQATGTLRFQIPSIGDKIVLVDDWEFPLYAESRNWGLMKRLRPGANRAHRSNESILAVLEAGTVLRVARIYIRQGKSEWDSVTFSVVSAPGDKNRKREEKHKGGRFWAKLADVNQIMYTPFEEST